MARLRVHNFTISLDGFAARPRQDQDNPLGERFLDGRLTGIADYSCFGLTCSAGIAHARLTRTLTAGK